MAIKFANELVKEIRKNGGAKVSEGYITGEAFENWLYEKNETISIKNPNVKNICVKDAIMPVFTELDFFPENYGEAA